jgi:hypothetical protein
MAIDAIAPGCSSPLSLDIIIRHGHCDHFTCIRHGCQAVAVLVWTHIVAFLFLRKRGCLKGLMFEGGDGSALLVSTSPSKTFLSHIICRPELFRPTRQVIRYVIGLLHDQFSVEIKWKSSPFFSASP